MAACRVDAVVLNQEPVKNSHKRDYTSLASAIFKAKLGIESVAFSLAIDGWKEGGLVW